jgi:hypothetical protein
MQDDMAGIIRQALVTGELQLRQLRGAHRRYRCRRCRQRTRRVSTPVREMREET